MTQTIIPHSRPTLAAEEALAASEVISSGHIAQGKKVEAFEKALASFVGVKGAVLVNSGTSSIYLGLLSMGIGAGDEVILPSFVCSAPLNAIYATGATPKICDIEPESFNVSLENIESVRTESTKAIIVPHMFGNVADLAKIESLNIPVIEDCAHSIGAKYGKKMAGSIGKFSIVSFYANKMMACGEGGVILSDDENIINTARDLRDYDEKDNYKVRYNYKMTDIQASIGIVQLDKLKKSFVNIRKEIASEYDKAFESIDITIPNGEFDHVYYRYVIKTKNDIDKVISDMKEQGIVSARPVYKPLNRFLEIRGGYRNTDEAYSTALSIPIYPTLDKNDQTRVIEAVKTVLG